MVLRLLPDVEALCVDYLKAHASIVALTTGRVSPELPARPAFPYLTVSLVAGTEVIGDHLDESLIQLAAWANDKTAANLLIRTARAALLEAPESSHARGVITGVRTLVTPHWFPDDVATPARPRYLCDMGVTVHPHLL